jgi:hypothetical protein
LKLFKRIALVFLLLLICFSVFFYFSVMFDEPKVDWTPVSHAKREKGTGDIYYSGNNWLKKNPYGLYEMYIEGGDFERGYINGLLSQELVKKQEDIFVGRLNELMPNKWYQQFLRAVIGWMNRNLDEHIDAEYLREIYGVSRSASDEYDYIAPKYQRILNYHAAHDIGHALQNMNLVACTSVGLWGKNTLDSTLLIGRNFDFYMGEEFAKDKIVVFVHPDSGYNFASVTWGGFTGIVSGMNEEGLTVTLNAAKTGLPGSATTPVSIIARKILQYSTTISQAYQIANSYPSFVAESFMIGSKKDGKVAIIEKTPNATTLYEVADQMITCSNHFQGKEWALDSLNQENIRESPTEKRRERLIELIQPQPKMDYLKLADILRNPLGSHNQDMGMGNENALNQFVAHHSVIFNPDKGLIWVSAFPYQLGAFVAYDLHKIFHDRPGLKENIDVSEPQLLVAADPFLSSKKYQDLLFAKAMTEKIRKIVWNEEGEISKEEIQAFIESNPHYFHTYFMLGNYFKSKNLDKEAALYYRKALTLEIPRLPERKAIEEKLSACNGQK